MGSEQTKDHAPLAGVVMCCTSILPDERQALALSATAMGADHKYDLTSDVTHLIVGAVDTSKYKYVAKERPDVKVVLPAFVDAVKESWMKGGDTDVRALEQEYRVPTFYNLLICVTGFENVKREEIISIVKDNGAEYHGDLTKKITHLIAASAEGNKYEHARRWGVKTVGQEWLVDSVERGMVLDEKLYDPILAPADRGKNAWNRQITQSIVLGKRQWLEENVAEMAPNRRKLRRVMSAKLGTQQDTIWADIASAGSGQLRQEEWQAQQTEEDSLLDKVPTKASTSADTTPDPTIEPIQKSNATNKQSGLLHTNGPDPGVFGGAVVYAHGFDVDKAAILSAHLKSHGAHVYTTPESLELAAVDRNGYLVTPHNVPEERLPLIPLAAANLRPVTEFWVERCLIAKILINPDDHPLCRPFAKLIIKGFHGITVCSTGFKGIELLHLTKFVEFMGGTYDEYLKPGASLLLCNAAFFNQDKVDFAMENNVPIANENWLWACMDTGSLQDFNAFPVKKETPTVRIDYQPQHSKVYKQVEKSTRSIKRARPLQLDSKPQQLDRSGHAAPAKELAVQVSRKIGPFIEEDSEDEAAVDIEPPMIESEPSESVPPLPEPLRVLSQEQINAAPKKPAATSETFPDKHDADSTSTTTKPLGSATSDTYLNNSIAALLAQKQQQRSSRAPSNPPIEDNRARRKRGLLGRAASGSSSTSLSHEHSALPQPSHSQPQDVTVMDPPLPSQKIIYEDEKVREERVKLIKRMGGQVDAGLVVESVKGIGIVKDTIIVSDTGVAGRVRRRGK